MTAAPSHLSSGTKSAILPCPFCGSEAIDRRKIDGFPMIYCNGDDCFGPQTTAKSFDDALVQWNTRCSSPAPQIAGGVSPDDVRAAVETLGYDLKLREFAPRTEIGIRNFNERCEGLAAALSRSPTAGADQTHDRVHEQGCVRSFQPPDHGAPSDPAGDTAPFIMMSCREAKRCLHMVPGCICDGDPTLE